MRSPGDSYNDSGSSNPAEPDASRIVAEMEDDAREGLEELADQLDAHTGENSEAAAELSAHVRGAIESGEHEGLRERLMENAVDFEIGHPDLAAVIERAMALLSGGGL